MTQLRTGRGYAATIVCLALSGLAVLWALAQPWAEVTVHTAFGSSTTLTTGSQLHPLAYVGAWIMCASVLAVVATRGVARRVIAGLVVVSAVPIVFAAVAGLVSGSAAVWAGVTLVAGLIGLAAAWVLWTFGPGWRSLSSRQGGTARPAGSLWDALDRGEDPTAADENRVS